MYQPLQYVSKPGTGSFQMIYNFHIITMAQFGNGIYFAKIHIGNFSRNHCLLDQPPIYFSYQLDKNVVETFLLFQQTADQSTILFLFRTFDKILQTCSVVKNSAATAATIQTDMAVSDSDAWKLWLTVIATHDKCQ